jgi:hypothetical protein
MPRPGIHRAEPAAAITRSTMITNHGGRRTSVGKSPGPGQDDETEKAGQAVPADRGRTERVGRLSKVERAADPDQVEGEIPQSAHGDCPAQWRMATHQRWERGKGSQITAGAAPHWATSRGSR